MPTDLLGTPGYLAPEMLQKSVEADSPGYNREVDMYVIVIFLAEGLAIYRVCSNGACVTQVGLWGHHVHSVSILSRLSSLPFLLSCFRFDTSLFFSPYSFCSFTD